MYQLQISTSPTFNTTVFDSCSASGSCSCLTTGNCDQSATSISVFVLPSSTNATVQHLTYGATYYWRVKVWDAFTGKDSGWVSYTNASSNPVNTYTYPYAHPSPWISYSTPTSASPGTWVVFVDQSNCYDRNQNSYSCSSLTSNTYTWTYRDGYADNTLGNASHRYSSPGTYGTKLQICDDIGCCYATAGVHITNSNANNVPQWSEISPYNP